MSRFTQPLVITIIGLFVFTGYNLIDLQKPQAQLSQPEAKTATR